MGKKNLIILLLGVILCIPFSLFAETIVLKSGKQVEGKIIEDTESYIKIETTDGNSVYYNKNTIEAIKSPQSDSLSLSFKTGLIDCSGKGYMLFIPKDISSTSPSTFLICLPGWGISAKQDINNWAFYAVKKGFIVVDLDMNYNAIGSNSDVDRLYLKISNILTSLVEEYPVLNNKVCIAGTSAGGMMSIALGLRYPNKFLAIGVVSGARLDFGAETNLKNARGQWFYIAHGLNDKSIHISEFYSTKEQLERNGAIVQYKVIPEGAHTLSSGVYQEVVDWLSKAK